MKSPFAAMAKGGLEKIIRNKETAAAKISATAPE
jgi:hypothetical protein